MGLNQSDILLENFKYFFTFIEFFVLLWYILTEDKNTN